jgi:hypothetical protein
MYTSVFVGGFVVLVAFTASPIEEQPVNRSLAPSLVQVDEDPEWHCWPHFDLELGDGHWDDAESDPLLWNASAPDPQHYEGHARRGCFDDHSGDGGGGGGN